LPLRSFTVFDPLVGLSFDPNRKYANSYFELPVKSWCSGKNSRLSKLVRDITFPTSPLSRRISGQLSSIALGYGLYDRVFESRQRLEIFSLHHRVQTGSTQWVPGTLFLVIKRSEREADHTSI
jgi:hypothetical protein